MLVAISEMLIAGSTTDRPLGCELLPDHDGLEPSAFCFAETPSRYILEISPLHLKEVDRHFAKADIPCREVGVLDHSGRLRCSKLSLEVEIEHLARAWRGTLDW